MGRIVVARGPGRGGSMQRVDEHGDPGASPAVVADLAVAMGELEASEHPRWVWESAATDYAALLGAGVLVERSHDLALVEAALLGYAGRFGESSRLAAAAARLRNEPVPPDEPARPTATQPGLFDDTTPRPLDDAVAVHAAQCAQLASPDGPDAWEPAPVTAARLRLLAATDSACGLVAAEMGHDGVPWRIDVHDRLLTEALGPRPRHGGRPPRLQALAERIAALLDVPRLNPDSAAEITTAFRHAGILLTSTRSFALRRLDHPAIEPLLEYKALARLHAAHGWAWSDEWVRDGRFRPEYVPAGVVSGRWASRGGGALQIPRAVRAAVVADPGHVLVVADARQLEPRVLAALSVDAGLIDAARSGDLYDAMATEAFAGDRATAKIAILSAMYGGGTGGGSSAVALATFRRRYPRALGLVEAAARVGEAGGLVRSVLGRTCPYAGVAPAGTTSETDDVEAQALRRSRDRGRFTRNFVIQASAADWAGVLLAVLRGRLAGIDDAARLVFFQHDEVVVHAPQALAGEVAAAIDAAADEATRLVFGSTDVSFPMPATVVPDYAAAK
ncbi:MAG: bifunctional 3'-5' exonuclease/DNA polymerase [Pseudonocardiales bacterium]|nr:MAG: bifunctional 3'-5' exonuclease/DNA polymerase [Pseudonocardiales bacterium]